MAYPLEWRPPISQEARIEAGQMKTVPWAGMYVSGPYRGNYNIGDPKPQTLTTIYLIIPRWFEERTISHLSGDSVSWSISHTTYPLCE